MRAVEIVNPPLVIEIDYTLWITSKVEVQVLCA